MSEKSLLLPQDEESKQINTFNNKDENEDTIEGARNIEIGVYWQRWYILTITVLSTVCMTAVWNTWGPIAQSAKAAYGWSDTTITVLQNCGNGGTLVTLLPIAFITGRAGFRVAMLISTFLIALGAGLRLIRIDNNIFGVVIMGVAQFLNGVGGSVTQVIPPAISETWFPVHERTTATAVMLMANIVGGAVSFVMGKTKHDFPATKNSGLEGFYFYSYFSCMFTDIDPTEITTIRSTRIRHIRLMFLFTDFVEMKHQVWMYLLAVFAGTAVVFLLTLVYFPAKPRRHPSKSASVQRLEFKSLLKLFRNVRIWQITVVCALPFAVFANWIGLLDVHFHRAGVSQTEAGWIGLFSSLGGAACGILLGRIADCYQRHMKSFAISMYTIAFLGILWTLLMILALLPRSVVLFGLSTTLINSSMNAATPLLYEMSCETGFPAAEEIMAMLIGLCNNVGGVVYLLIQLIPHIGTLWMTCAFCGVQAVCIPALVLFKQHYTRLDVDINISKGN